MPNKKEKNHEIVICMGSSCFSRGNKKTVTVIQQYLSDNELYDHVTLRGAHCFGDCVNGPILKIDNKTYNHVSAIKVINILDSYFKDNLKE